MTGLQCPSELLSVFEENFPYRIRRFLMKRYDLGVEIMRRSRGVGEMSKAVLSSNEGRAVPVSDNLPGSSRHVVEGQPYAAIAGPVGA